MLPHFDLALARVVASGTSSMRAVPSHRACTLCVPSLKSLSSSNLTMRAEKSWSLKSKPLSSCIKLATSCCFRASGLSFSFSVFMNTPCCCLGSSEPAPSPCFTTCRAKRTGAALLFISSLPSSRQTPITSSSGFIGNRKQPLKCKASKPFSSQDSKKSRPRWRRVRTSSCNLQSKSSLKACNHTRALRDVAIGGLTSVASRSA
mmetsp:Transcript_49128/g.117004  ORF Transcript_49128/g.117004 Transcript_49128/m.117004 type:complete len:204 (-) Transcript_49128:1516-2127(-)